MRDPGLERVIDRVGGVQALAKIIGISQPAVSMWKKIPAERVIEIEAATGIDRSELRPDLYPVKASENSALDTARASEYALLGALLWRAPGADLLRKLASLKGDATPIGLAHLDLGLAAAEAKPEAVEREFFNLFIGLGRGELMPYASYYLTGFLHERPLANIRDDLAQLGIERESRVHEPEDHIAVLCEVMSGLISGSFATDASALTDKVFFERHLSRWAARFFADLEMAESASFYKSVGRLGRTFMEIEAEAFALPDL
jgi:TorA maturation chaperone TorD